MDSNQLNNFQLGINKDIHNINTQEGMYTFALNAVNDSKEGNNTAITTELGNREVGVLPNGYYPIGSINTGEGFIVFIKDDLGNSEIGIINKIYNYTTIINNPCLNFTKQIQGVFKIFNGCDRIIYFVDGVNPDRSINIDDLLKNSTNSSYHIDGIFDCSLIKLKPDLLVPCLSEVEVSNTGGNLKLGSYQIVLNYEDKNGNSTYYAFHSQELKIIYGTLNNTYTNLTGGDPLTYPNTTKSINLTFSNVDTRFKYLKITVGYTANSVTTFYEIDKLAITDDILNYTLSTINTNSAIPIDAAQIIVENNPYNSSETITQHDSRLIRGNLKSAITDFSKFQILANNIKVNYVTIPIPSNNSRDKGGSIKSNTYYLDYKSYMRDEIYSLGIVPIFKDGTEGPVLHIPGRALNTPNYNTFPLTDTNDHNRPDHSTGFRDQGWDSAYIQASDLHGNILPDFKHIQENEFESPFIINPNRKYLSRWKAFNTAYRTEKNTASLYNSYTKGELAYWESSQYRYPVVQSCEGTYIYPVEEVNNEIIGQKIRHHKMPDTTLEEHFLDDNTIVSLGLELTNITFPPEYVNDIQGYYIVREKRTDINKTIVDKGIIFRNSFFRIVEDCVDGENEVITDYQTQTTTYNLHNYHKYIQPAPFNPRIIYTPYGLFPMYSEIDPGEFCGRIGFRDQNGSALSNETTVRNFLQFDNKSQSFHGPSPKFKKQNIGANLFKSEKLIAGILQSNTPDDFDICGSNYLKRRLNYVNYNTTLSNSSLSSTNRLLSNIPVYIEPNSIASSSILSKTFLNNNQQETLVIETIDTLNGTILETDTGYDPGDISIAYYGSLKSSNNSIYGQLDNRIYYKASNCLHSKDLNSVTIFGGDTFINKFSFMRSSLNKMATNFDCYYTDADGTNCGEDGVNKNPSSFTLEKNLVTYFVESEVNSELRHIGFSTTELADIYNTFYPLFNGTEDNFLILDYNGDNGAPEPVDCVGAFGPWHCDTYMRNLYLYNSDFSKENNTKPYISLSIDYDFCNECAESFPRRITFSERGYQEESADNYRVFLPNSYRDLPGNTGELTNLFVTYDELYAHTPRTLYKIYTKAQNLQSNEATLYVGTGDFFSIPPKELVTTEYGYAGSSQKWATKTTEFGTVFIDDLSGKIFLLTDTLKELSNLGLRNWFEENIPLNLPLQYYTETGLEYNLFNQPSIKNGVGYITTYDPRHKRIIITKKDYVLKSEITDLEDYALCPEGNIVFENYQATINAQEILGWNFIGIEGCQLKFEKEGSEPLFIDGIEVEGGLFDENKSWTISYSFLSNSWISWHSYLPTFYLNDANSFYSFDNYTSPIWKHNEVLYTNYYENKYNYIIEFPVFSINTQSISSIYWISNTQQFIEQDKYWLDIPNVTFDKGIVYNRSQTTGKFNIVPKLTAFDNINWSNIEKVAAQTDRDWKLSGLRDISINSTNTVMTSDWSNTDFQTEFIDNGYIDKAVKTAVLNPNKTLFELADIKDKVNYVRLFFKPENNYKKILFVINSANDNYSR
jgi:hypothetical protein